MGEIGKSIPLHRVRSQLAGLFSDIFLNPPQLQQLDSLVVLLDNYYEHGLSESDCFARGLGEFAEWRSGREFFSDEEQRLSLERNYTGLFCIGRGVVTTASAMLSPQRVHKWEPWSKVRRFYYEYGLRLAEESQLYEDSIVTELAFYSLLIDQLENLAFSNRKKAFKVQQRFLNKHLLIWLPQFCDELRRVAGQESVYCSIASFLKCYMQDEQRVLDQSILFAQIK